MKLSVRDPKIQSIIMNPTKWVSGEILLITVCKVCPALEDYIEYKLGCQMNPRNLSGICLDWKEPCKIRAEPLTSSELGHALMRQEENMGI
jgi:hypothetical protein